MDNVLSEGKKVPCRKELTRPYAGARFEYAQYTQYADKVSEIGKNGNIYKETKQISRIDIWRRNVMVRLLCMIV